MTHDPIVDVIRRLEAQRAEADEERDQYIGEAVELRKERETLLEEVARLHEVIEEHAAMREKQAERIRQLDRRLARKGGKRG